jgi:low temperature requirement protein LtrA
VSKNNEIAKEQLDEVVNVSPSMVERFGLFSIIVLGEIVVAVVSGVSSVELNLNIGFIALSGTLAAIGLWWLYFDLISHRKPKKNLLIFQLYYYLHLPLTGGIVMVGASLLNLISHSEEALSFNTHITFISGVSLTMVCIALVMKLIEAHQEFRNFFKYGTWLIIALAGLLYLTLLFDLNVLLLLIITVITLLIPVFIGFLSWLKLKKS